ncbi:alpha/beta fold hydrolase [Actinopolyspora mortivallis]|uniref:alpha/beta fold hydrolase n=1 Tax=Actinopolyspora mortivallis TaxID=33906 RepID=UPI000373E8B0|nr:alpha/beta hydrolase [Actinopolyspora mortivallis]
MTAPTQDVHTEHLGFPAGTVRYHRAGDTGPAVVLLHGGGVDNALISWRHTIAPLAADHRVYLPDLPGHGGSKQWSGTLGQRTLEEVLRWLLDSWGVSRAVLVGSSVGGSAAVGFALRHPERVRGLVLTGCEGLRHSLPNQLGTYLRTRVRLPDRTVTRLLALRREFCGLLTRRLLYAPDQLFDREQLLTELHAELRERTGLLSGWYSETVGSGHMRVNHLPGVHGLRCPTVLVHGEHDSWIPLATAEKAARAIPGCDLRVIRQAGHWCHREKPGEFNGALREFVNRLG